MNKLGIQFYKDPSGFWLRVLGKRFVLCNDKHPVTFSERNGYKKVYRVPFVKGWRFWFID